MKNNFSGQSLVQVMVGAALMGVVMMGFASMMTIQQKEVRALSEKLSALSLKSLLSYALADGTVCLRELTDPTPRTFNSSSAAALAQATISVQQLRFATGSTLLAKENTLASADSNTLRVQSIQLTNFQGSGTSYTANWLISFDASKTVRPINPITIPVKIEANNATPAATAITGCMAASAAAAAGPSASGSQVFTSSGSFTVPEGVTRVFVTLVGAGAGGDSAGGCGASGGSSGNAGGGAGSTLVGVYVPVTPGSIIPVTIGAGGNAGTPGGAISVFGSDTCFGKDGGSSSFGSLLFAPGGIGGKGGKGGYGETGGGPWSPGENGISGNVGLGGTGGASGSRGGGGGGNGGYGIGGHGGNGNGGGVTAGGYGAGGGGAPGHDGSYGGKGGNGYCVVYY